MPNVGVVTAIPVAELNSVQPEVWINDQLYDYVVCSSIEDSTGAIPSKALFRVGGLTNDVAGPITLNRFPVPWKQGARVEVWHGNTCYFLGNMIKRRDQGKEDIVIWEAWDDRWLLNKIPVRGCLVYDPVDEEVKYIARYVARFNPEGRWNCVGAGIDNNVYPVFTWVAEVGRSYESPTEVFAEPLAAGVLTAWTPLRALMYFQLLTTLESGDVPGIDAKKWRTLKNSTRLSFPTDSLNVSAADLAQSFDPLNRKLPDMTVQARGMAGAIDEVLKSFGTHGLKLEYTSTDENRALSAVSFYPKVKGNTDPGYKLTIPLLRGGNATDVNTGYDFELDEEAEEISEAVLVEGAAPHVESEFQYNNNVADTFVPAWTAAEQTAFLTCIKGQADAGGTRYALFPATQNDTDVTKFLRADGTGGRALVIAGGDSQPAIALARASFPRVFRAFKIDVTMFHDIAKGVGAKYAGQPFLRTPRPVRAAQLQYFTNAALRLLEHFPVRVQVRDVQTGGYHDVTSSTGFRMTEDGLIWLDGLAENIDGAPDCIYGYPTGEGLAIIGATTDLAPFATKLLKINAAIPLDTRIFGYKEADAGERLLDDGLSTDLGGPLLLYVDSPNAYHEPQQVASRPGPFEKYFAGDSVVTVPLTRYLPPGSEESHAQDAAVRKIAFTKNLRRRSSWKMVGVRPEFRAGLWVDKVVVINAPAGDRDYDISAPVETVTYDFIGQRTLIGGLISELSRNMPTSDNAKQAAEGTKLTPEEKWMQAYFGNNA